MAIVSIVAVLLGPMSDDSLSFPNYKFIFSRLLGSDLILVIHVANVDNLCFIACSHFVLFHLLMQSQFLELQFLITTVSKFLVSMQ